MVDLTATGPRLIELKGKLQALCTNNSEFEPNGFFEALKAELQTPPSPLETAILFCAADRCSRRN